MTDLFTEPTTPPAAPAPAWGTQTPTDDLLWIPAGWQEMPARAPAPRRVPGRALVVAVVAAATVVAVGTLLDGGHPATPPAPAVHAVPTPTSTASPTTPPAVARALARYSADLGDTPTDDYDPCAGSPVPDQRWGDVEARRRYVAAGLPWECLTPFDWQGSAEPDGIRACLAYQATNPGDPLFLAGRYVCDPYPAPTTSRPGLLERLVSAAGEGR